MLIQINWSVNAQGITNKVDSVKAKHKNSFLVAPLISNTPETAWAFALASAYIFKTNKKDTLLRTSTMPSGIAYTSRNQLLIALGGNIFLPKERYIIRFENSYSNFPDRFWGLGSDTYNRTYESYSFNQLYLNPQLHRKIWPGYFVGFGWDFQRVFKVEYSKGGYFDQDQVIGRTPYKISGYSIYFTYDTRNHAYVPDKGALFRVKFNDYHNFTGSDFKFNLVEVDFRKFIKSYTKNILAIQFYSNFKFGDVPLRSLASLGGNNIMRGYYAGRFRDRMFLATQAEYRFPIYWRFAGVGFVGVGQVMDKFQSFNLNRFKISVGTGLRFAILPKEKLNLRFDIAFGNYNSFTYYLILAESF